MRILLSESAHLIWKLRCERLIQNANVAFSEVEIRNRWVNAINRRLDTDRLMTHQKYESKALDATKVQRTWSGVLRNEDSLPSGGWLRTSGVLVGITAKKNRTGCG